MLNKQLTPKQFDRLSKAKRAVLIAEDVLLRLKKGTYKGNTGAYVCMNKSEDVKDSNSARECIIQNQANCTVCARGALFLSSIVFRNEFSVEEVYSVGFSDLSKIDYYTEGTKFIAKTFSERQQALIECFYEGDIGIEIINLNLNGTDRKIVCKYRDSVIAKIKKRLKINRLSSKVKDTELLKFIMKNIIKNNGTFVVPGL